MKKFREWSCADRGVDSVKAEEIKADKRAIISRIIHIMLDIGDFPDEKEMNEKFKQRRLLLPYAYYLQEECELLLYPRRDDYCEDERYIFSKSINWNDINTCFKGRINELEQEIELAQYKIDNYILMHQSIFDEYGLRSHNRCIRNNSKKIHQIEGLLTDDNYHEKVFEKIDDIYQQKCLDQLDYICDKDGLFFDFLLEEFPLGAKYNALKNGNWELIEKEVKDKLIEYLYDFVKRWRIFSDPDLNIVVDRIRNPIKYRIERLINSISLEVQDIDDTVLAQDKDMMKIENKLKKIYEDVKKLNVASEDENQLFDIEKVIYEKLNNI